MSTAENKKNQTTNTQAHTFGTKLFFKLKFLAPF